MFRVLLNSGNILLKLTLHDSFALEVYSKMSKKITVIYAVLALILIASLLGILLPQPDVRVVFSTLTATLAILGLFFLAVFSGSRARKNLGKKFHEVQKTQLLLLNRIAALHKKADSLGDYAGTTLRLTRMLYEEDDSFLETSNRKSFSVEDNERAELPERGSDQSYFSPLYVPSVPIRRKPSPHLPGRQAAAQLNRGSSERQYNALLNETPSSNERHVCVVGGSGLIKILESESVSTALYPHFGLEQLTNETSYLIIDGSNIENTPWAGVFNAHQ